MSSLHWFVALPLALVLLALAAVGVVTAVRGRRGSLVRDGRLGVRSAAATLSPQAFVLANRVAWPIVAGAAVVAGVCGLVLAAAPLALATVLIVFALALAGSTILLVKAGQLGDRAAKTVPVPARKPGGASCGGCACGGGGCAGLTRNAPAATTAG